MKLKEWVVIYVAAFLFYRRGLDKGTLEKGG